MNTAAASGNDSIHFFDSGLLNNVEWVQNSVNRVQSLCDDLEDICRGYPDINDPDSWIGVVVIQDVLASPIVYHRLLHTKGPNNGNLANLANFAPDGPQQKRKLAYW